MISISARGPASEAVSYYEHLLSEYGPADYYSREGEGHFFGAGIEAFGIEPGVGTDAEKFQALAEGRHPSTGEPLVQSAGNDHRAGWDVTLSPPKSVSVIWGLGAPNARAEIESAHQESVKKTLDYLESHAAYTRRGGGWMSEAERREKIDGCVVAQYQHGTSREADPQLHSHLMVFNLARRSDGSYGSIEPREIYRHQSAAGAIYDAELAHGLRARGYAVEREGRSFSVAGVPGELVKEFSTRREQIESELERRGASGSHASEAAALATRRKKEVRDIDGLRADWAARAKERAPEWAAEQAHGIEQPALDAVPSSAEILRGLTEQRSTFSAQDVTAAVGIAGIGTLSADEVERAADRVLHDMSTVELRGRDGLPRYTTREMIEVEATMASRAERMAQSGTHGVASERVQAALEARPTLSDEQRRAIEHVTAPGAVALVQGGAGTGKTFALAAAREAWEAEGFRIRGVALAGKAAEGLESGSGIQSGTLHSLLRDTSGETVQGIEYQARDPLRAGDIVVLDEAGMVGSRQLAELLARAEDAGAKVVMIGDARQLQAIDAGAAFRAIQERTGSVGLDDIRRQHTEADRQAVRDLRDGRAKEALENLRARGRVHEYKTARDAAHAAGKAVADDLAAGKSTVAVVGTRAEARAVNLAARTAGVSLGTVEREGITVETTIGVREFSKGDRVILLRNDRDLAVKNGDFGTVKKIERGDDAHVRLTMRLDRDSSERVIDPDKYAHVDHGYAATAHKLQGATIDRAHILASDSPMSSREWAYVAGSRARDETHIHGEKSAIKELAPDWSRSKPKDSTLDYRAEGKDKSGQEHQMERGAPLEGKNQGKREAGGAEKTQGNEHQGEKKTQAREADKPDPVQKARESMNTLREYQYAADLHRQARWQERAEKQEPDREKAVAMRESAWQAHARADAIRARAWEREKNLPSEYRREVRQAELEAQSHDKEALRQEDRAGQHYRDAGAALHRAQDPRTGLVNAVGAASEYREAKWKAERAAGAAKEAGAEARVARRNGTDKVWDRARDGMQREREAREQERTLRRQAARETERERGSSHER